MGRVALESRPEISTNCEASLLIEKGFLLLGSFEFQIEEHLMANGTRIGPETRFFLAQIRDAAGAAAEESRKKALAYQAEESSAPAQPSAQEEEERCSEPAALALDNRTSADWSSERPVSSHRRASRKLRLVPVFAAVVAAIALYSDDVFVGQSDPATAGAENADSERSLIREPIHLSEQGAEPTGFAAPEKSLPMVTADHEDHARLMIEPYPDPRANMAAAARPLPTPETEAALNLSRRSKMEVQRRLALAEFDPQMVDGIFGPATRAAIAAWQESADLPATGYLDEAMLTVLAEVTEDDYRSWRSAKQARERRQRERLPVQEGPVLSAWAENAQICRRSPSGEILYGESIKCDVRGLKEDFRDLRSKAVRLIRRPETVRAAAEPGKGAAPGGA